MYGSALSLVIYYLTNFLKQKNYLVIYLISVVCLLHLKSQWRAKIFDIYSGSGKGNTEQSRQRASKTVKLNLF